MDISYCGGGVCTTNIPDNKIHGPNMWPIWVLSAPDGPHVGPGTLLPGLTVTDYTTHWSDDTLLRRPIGPTDWSPGDAWPIGPMNHWSYDRIVRWLIGPTNQSQEVVQPIGPTSHWFYDLLVLRGTYPTIWSQNVASIISSVNANSACVLCEIMKCLYFRQISFFIAKWWLCDRNVAI